MRIVPVLLATMLVGGLVQAQQPGPTPEAHCEPDPADRDRVPGDIEHRCLPKLDGLASRMDGELRLKLEDGSTKTFVDDSAACDRGDADHCLEHFLTDYYPTQKLFVINRVMWEFSDVQAVSRRTGATITMEDRPHLSPNGKHFVVAAAGAPDRRPGQYTAGIYGVDRGTLKLAWVYRPTRYEEWDFVSWEGDDRIRLQVGYEKPATQFAEIRRTVLGWQLIRISP